MTNTMEENRLFNADCIELNPPLCSAVGILALQIDVKINLR